MKKMINYFGAIVLILAGLFYYFFYYNIPLVEVVKAEKGNIQRTVVDTGYVQPVDDYEIYSEQDGKIIKLDTARGQKVAKNQIIMILENQDISMVSQYFLTELNRAQTDISSAETALAKAVLEEDDAQKNYERVSALFSAEAVSQAQLDASLLALNKAQKNVEELTNNVELDRGQIDNYLNLYNTSKNREEKLIIRSPFEGIILKLPVELGNVIKAGTIVASVAPSEKLEIKADLLGDDLGDVKIGQKVRVVSPVLGEQVLNGEIIEIYPEAEEKLSVLGVYQRRVPVIIKLDDASKLKPGYEIRVSVITSNRENVILVPRQTIFSDAAGTKKVMVIKDGKVKHAFVKTGIRDNINIEITDGLTAGDILIKDASKIMKENTKVRFEQ